jgi:hypothetical protein
MIVRCLDHEEHPEYLHGPDAAELAGAARVPEK